MEEKERIVVALRGSTKREKGKKRREEEKRLKRRKKEEEETRRNKKKQEEEEEEEEEGKKGEDEKSNKSTRSCNRTSRATRIEDTGLKEVELFIMSAADIAYYQKQEDYAELKEYLSEEPVEIRWVLVISQ